jgi:2,3-bisphosphoglycerate-dependent phosphoglycerate mutase
MHKLVLLRHGRSLADDENKIEGRYDSPLTETGSAQAKATITRLQALHYNFSAIFCSTLQRSRRTAEILNEYYQIPIISSNLLDECDNGVLAGLERQTADQRYPLVGEKTPLAYFPDDSGENGLLLQARALQALDLLCKQTEGEYLVVAHGGILNALVRVIMNIPLPTLGSTTVFQFTDNGFMELDLHKNNYRWIVRRLEN